MGKCSLMTKRDCVLTPLLKHRVHYASYDPQTGHNFLSFITLNRGRPNMGGYVAHGFWLAGLIYLVTALIWGW